MRRALSILFALGALGAVAVALAERQFAAAPRRAEVRQNAADPDPAPVEPVRQVAAATAPVRPAPPTVSAAPTGAPESPETTPMRETGISGVLLDARGVPLPHQPIIVTTAYSHHAPLTISFTDQYGAFRLRLEPAVYLLRASVDDQSLDDIEIALSDGERLDGLELQLTAHPHPRGEQAREQLDPDEPSERDDDGPSDDRPPIKRRVIVIDPIGFEGDVDLLRPEPPSRTRRLEDVIY
jgi:hypothetical protein